jgi:hypothetical protein
MVIRSVGQESSSKDKVERVQNSNRKRSGSSSGGGSRR